MIKIAAHLSEGKIHYNKCILVFRIVILSEFLNMLKSLCQLAVINSK